MVLLPPGGRQEARHCPLLNRPLDPRLLRFCLLQGTPEYKDAFSKALDTLKPEEPANLTYALIYAMDILENVSLFATVRH